MKVLALGPLPPPFGGTTVSFDDFRKHITNLPVAVTVIDTNHKSAGSIFSQIRVVIRSWVRVFGMAKKVDVITMHASVVRFAWYGAMLRVIGWVTGKPIILRSFGGSLDIYYAQAGSLTRSLFKLAFANNIILLQTRYLVEYFRKIYGKARIDWLPNCRPIKALRENRSLYKGCFVFVGHVDKSKGILTIVNMLRRHREDGLRIDVIGRIGKGFSQKALYTTPGLKYLGVLAPEDVMERIGNYEALILPTHFRGEGYPGVILEAYTQGTPVVATRWRAIPEIVKDGETGFLIECGDIEQLYQALIRIRGDADLRLKMSKNAIQLAQCFDSEYWHYIKWRDWLASALSGTLLE